MADWLRLPSGHAVNMDHVFGVRHLDGEEYILVGSDNTAITITGADSAVVRAYLERVHVGELDLG